MEDWLSERGLVFFIEDVLQCLRTLYQTQILDPCRCMRTGEADAGKEKIETT